jgi:transcriptional regulator with XRE-family HTH domain
MAAQGSPAVARHRLRLALRRQREATGRTQGDIAGSLDWSLSKLQRIEAGENAISTTDLHALLGELDVTDPEVIRALVAEAKVARGRSQWDKPPYREMLTPATKMLFEFEAVATTIRSFQTTLFPGNLQTREFAVKVLQTWVGHMNEYEREVRVEARVERRARVFNRPDPPQYMLVLDEAMLHRNVGGARIYAQQLRHVLDEAEAGRIQLRVAPFDVAAVVIVQFPFTILTMTEDEDSVLYRENYDSDEIIQAPERVLRQREIFDRLWNESLSAAASVRVIEERVTGLLSSTDREPTRRIDL